MSGSPLLVGTILKPGSLNFLTAAIAPIDQTLLGIHPGTHARKDEDGLLLEFPYNPTRTCTV
jgi:hypothetical protein